MIGNPGALDTNQAINILNGTDGTGRWAVSLWEVCLPVTVVGESLFGAINSNRIEENLAAVENLVVRSRVLPTDAMTTRAYGQIRARLKKKGTPIPENDVWIAAVCVQHAIPLATSDAHFSYIDELAVISR